MNSFCRNNGIFKWKMFKQGMSILILAVFVLLALGSGSKEPAAKKETKQEMEARLERNAAERARGRIELTSDVEGKVLLNGKETTYTVSSRAPITLTIENANGEYEILVRDSNGTVWQANKTVNIKGGSQERVFVENPNYVTSPNDFTYIQNTDGGLTITGYKSNHPKLVIPETISGVKVTWIGDMAFPASSAILTDVVIPNTVTIIGDGAFLSIDAPWGPPIYVPHKIDSLVIPDSVLLIGRYAFINCGLSSLTLGNKLTNIGDSAFSDNALTTVTIPNSVTSIGNGTFSRNALKTITISNGVTSIGSGAFSGNPITTIVIPPSLVRFGGAFSGTASTVARITLPVNVDERNLTSNFDQNFVNYYISQNRRAGTYTKENSIWRLTTPR